MEHSRSPAFSHESDLSLRDEVLVKTASVIDENGKRYDHPRGQQYVAAWSDPFNDQRFSLTAVGERIDPESMEFNYTLRKHSKSSKAVKELYHYTSFFVDFRKAAAKNGHVKMQKCTDDDMRRILEYLSIAPTGLSEEVDDEFHELMAENNIVDPRLHVRLRRLAAQALSRLRSE